MEISPLSPTTNTASQAQGTGSASALASDFDTFLQMLTAQARYQDPLEPLDSSEYSAQLAQFSMVEQQVQTNDLLSALSSALGASNMASLAGWVGMEARAAAPIHFDGTPITISPNPASISDRVDLVAYDTSGTEVARQRIPVSADAVNWNGTDSSGKQLPDGIYSFEVESYSNDENILTEPAQIYGRITEAQLANGETLLMLQGGTAVLASHVTALRAPSS